MARGRKTGGRKKGSRNRATAEARAEAVATGILPIDYMLAVMRDAAADHKRRDAMAMAAEEQTHHYVRWIIFAAVAAVIVGVIGAGLTFLH